MERILYVFPLSEAAFEKKHSLYSLNVKKKKKQEKEKEEWQFILKHLKTVWLDSPCDDKT